MNNPLDWSEGSRSRRKRSENAERVVCGCVGSGPKGNEEFMKCQYTQPPSFGSVACRIKSPSKRARRAIGQTETEDVNQTNVF